jgi:glutamine synthetase type III
MSRQRFNSDIRRHETVTERGWIDVRVTVEDTDAVTIDRTRRAFERRGALSLIGAPRSLEVNAERAVRAEFRPRTRPHRTLGERRAG